MSSAILFPDGATLVNGVDGATLTGLLDDCGGCNDIPCADKFGYVCSFLDVLPTGPMWDLPKAEVRQVLEATGDVPVDGLGCNSMVTYAVYMGQLLHYYVTEVLGQTLREADPCTAVNTLDDWLDRTGWQDCYRNACRPDFIASISPYESDNADCGGTSYCATQFPDEFERALKHGILMAMQRFRMGVIRNLEGINFVIEPLGAQMSAVFTPEVQAYLADPTACECPDNTDCGCGVSCPPCWCDDITFEVTNIGDTLPGAPTADSFCGDPPPTVAALQDYTNCTDNTVTQLYPGVIAAECIIRAMLPQQCPNIIFRV